MDSSDLYETREGDLELKGDVKPINYDVPSTEIGEIEKNDLETKELKGEELPINFEMTGPDVAVTEEISMPETEELITGRSVGEELDNSPIELSNDIVISEGENKIDFQQYSLKNIKDAKDEQDAVTLKQLSEYKPEIEDSSITTDKLANGAVTSAKIASGGVETGNIADNAITNDKLADNAVTTNEIADAAITTAKIGDAQVTSDKLASNAVTTDKLSDAQVTTNKIADNSITTAKIADNAVTNAKIKDMAWESYTGITKGSGVSAIGENHCMINRALKLFCAHIDLAFSNGAPSTLVSGLPEPAGNSKFLGCFVTSGTKTGQWLNCWVRASGGTLGCQTTTSSEAGGCHIIGIYPIK